MFVGEHALEHENLLSLGMIVRRKPRAWPVAHDRGNLADSRGPTRWTRLRQTDLLGLGAHSIRVVSATARTERFPLIASHMAALLEFLAVKLRAPDVDVGVLQQFLFFLRLQFADDFGRRAEDEDAVGIRFTFGDESARADDAAAADDGVVHDDRADADERAVADGAAVQHGLVADGDVLPEREGNARIGVQDRGVLDVGALADGDDVAVAADDGVEPDARLVVQDHGADDGGVLRDEPLLAVEYDFALAEGKDRHDRAGIIAERWRWSRRAACYHHALSRSSAE